MKVPTQEEINASNVNRLKNLWGEIPSWNEFKIASKEGRLRVSKPIALKYFFTPIIPTSYKIIFGIITIWSSLLSVPAFLIGWIFFDWSAWWLLAGLFIAWYLMDVSRNGHCQAIEEVALKNEDFYNLLINDGAFLFSPTETK